LHPPQTASTTSSNPLSITRTELALILAITAAGFAARFANLEDVAVEHFDEGVYASNLFFPDDGFAYPDRHLYAPPLVPAMIEWSMILFGENPTRPLLPSVILGSLTVPLIWLVTRRWFGSAAAVAAASLLALNDFHITMSRSALTDVPMVFFLLLAVWLIHEGVSQSRLGVAALGGLATGLAWSTKYNGWLPLAVALSGSAGGLIAQRIFIRRAEHELTKPSSGKVTRSVSEGAPASTRDVLFALAVPIIVAAVTWYPVWSDLPNGYSEVSANHSRYVGGLANWLPSLTQHEATQRHYAGIATWLSGLLAAVSATLVLRATPNSSPPPSGERVPEVRERGRSNSASVADSSTWNGEVPAITMFVAATLAGAIVLSPLVVLLAWSLVSFVTLIGRAFRAARTATPSDQARARAHWLALWFGLAWLCGLLLATPVYRPYPRLILPLQCVAMIGTAAAVVMLLTGQVLNAASDGEEGAASKGNARFAWLVAVMLLCAWRAFSIGTPGWQTRTELAEISADATKAATADCQGEPSEVEGYDFVVYVYGEPGLLHHVPASNERAFVKAVMDLSFTKPGYDHARIPAFVLAGPHALASLEFQKQVAEAGDALEEIGVYGYRPSDLVLLDDVPPAKLEEKRAQLVRLYRVHFRSAQ
jgi:dolichyl-phosphate-mannose-protein mannosyltransferase